MRKFAVTLMLALCAGHAAAGPVEDRRAYAALLNALLGDEYNARISAQGPRATVLAIAFVPGSDMASMLQRHMATSRGHLVCREFKRDVRAAMTQVGFVKFTLRTGSGPRQDCSL